jgi:ferredoxin
MEPNKPNRFAKEKNKESNNNREGYVRHDKFTSARVAAANCPA